MASNGAMRYGECMKNHAILFGGDAVHDGCREFMLGGHDKPLLCAACGCHRSFHRVFAATAIQGPFLVPTVQGPIVQGPTVQGPFRGPFQGPLGYYNNSNSLMPQMAAEMQFLNFVMLLARMISQASLEGPLAPVQAVRRQEPAGRQTRVRAAAPLAQPQPPPPPPTQPQPPPPANPQPPQRMAPPSPPKAPKEKQKQQANEDQLGSQKGKEEKGDGAGGIA